MTLVEKDCPECGNHALVERGDYLCVECRSAGTTYPPMPENVQELVNMAIKLWPGWVMVKESYDEEAHEPEKYGWVEIALVEPDTTSQGFAMSTYLNGWAIWKYNGNIYRLGRHSSVEDDPVSRAVFIAALTNPQSTIIPSLEKESVCNYCSGSGGNSPYWTCTDCNGTGK